jgi:predicted small secreted protein
MIVKKIALLSVLFSFAILSGGCETTKGVVTGVAEGVPKDAKNTWQGIKKADTWMKENLW